MLDYVLLVYFYVQNWQSWVSWAMQIHGILTPATALFTWVLATYYYSIEKQIFRKRRDIGYLVLAMTPVLVLAPFITSYTFLSWADSFKSHPRYLIWYVFLAETLLMGWVVVKQFFIFLQEDRERKYSIKQQQNRIEEQQSKLERLDGDLWHYHQLMQENMAEIETLQKQKENYQKYKEVNLVLQTRIEEVEKRLEEEKHTLTVVKQAKSKLENKPFTEPPEPSTTDKEVFGHIVNILEKYPEQTYQQYDKEKLKLSLYKLLKQEYPQHYQKQAEDTITDSLKSALYTCTHTHGKIPNAFTLDRKTKSSLDAFNTLQNRLYAPNSLNVLYVLVHYYRCENMIALMPEAIANKVLKMPLEILEKSGFKLKGKQKQHKTAERYFLMFYGRTYVQYYNELKDE